VPPDALGGVLGAPVTGRPSKGRTWGRRGNFLRVGRPSPTSPDEPFVPDATAG